MLVLTLVAIGSFALWRSSGRASNTDPMVGTEAPDFSLQTPDGETYRLSDLRGRAVLINFWATWCGPCRVEMPLLQERYTRYSPNLIVLGVDNNEPAEMVADFQIELGLTFPLLVDPGAEVNQLYRVRGYPSSYFIDAQGVVRVVHIGVMTERQLDDYLAQVGIQ